MVEPVTGGSGVTVDETSPPPARPGSNRPGEHDESILDRGATIDRYTVLERIGAGGMGEVYAAYDQKLDRKVALKVLRRRSAMYQKRLIREAQAMARLAHANVVAVFDAGTVDGRLFLAMEFVLGRTLKAWQRAATRSHDEVLNVYLAAGRGLSAAHAAGLVHRDFKPDNVLVSDAGDVKVTDFGIARATSEAATTRELVDRTTAPSASAPASDVALAEPMTEEGELLGTPGYMAPEQCLGEAADERSDQFAFCVSLYEALYGEKPFAGETVVAMLDATVRGAIREAPKGSTVPLRLRRVLVRGMSPEGADRYPSMRALLDDWCAIRRGKGRASPLPSAASRS